MYVEQSRGFVRFARANVTPRYELAPCSLRPNADSSSDSINSSRLLAFRTRGHTDNVLQPSPPHIVKFVRVPTAFRSAQLSSPKDVVRSVYHIAMSGHRGHRRCLCDSPPCPFSLAGTTEAPKAESGGRVLRRGQQPSPYHLGDLGNAVSSPSGGVPTAQRFSTIFSNQDGLS